MMMIGKERNEKKKQMFHQIVIMQFWDRRIYFFGGKSSMWLTNVWHSIGAVDQKKNQRWEECWWERNMMRFRALAPSFCSTHTNQYIHLKDTSADFDSICHIHIHMHDGDLVSFSIRSLSHRIRSHTLAYIVHNQPNQHNTHILTRRTIMHGYCIETESLDSQSHAHKHSGTVIVDDRFVFILFIAWSFAMNTIHLARTKHFVHLDQQIYVNNFCSIRWKWSINMQRFQSVCQFQVSCIRPPFVLFVQFDFKTVCFDS